MSTLTLPSVRLSFSGHETFYCRNLWLKKGYDFLASDPPKSFLSPDALYHLGVGKNMVASIRYWMRAFGLTQDDELSDLATSLFANEEQGGFDPYLEDLGSLWLLHWQLVTTERASIYALLFNDLRRDKVEFTQNNFLYFARRYAGGINQKYSSNTLSTDFNVAIRLYIPGLTASREPEDGYSGVLTELGLIRQHTRQTEDKQKETYFAIENTTKPTLPIEIVLYSILEQLGPDGNSIDFGRLLTDRNSVGSVFALSPQGLYDKLKSISEHELYSKFVVFSDQAGVKEFQLKKELRKENVLRNYFKPAITHGK